jgi:hypothetical protein
MDVGPLLAKPSANGPRTTRVYRRRRPERSARAPPMQSSLL